MTEQEAYVAMNPDFGPCGGARRLAGQNALWLDLDIYRVPSLARCRGTTCRGASCLRGRIAIPLHADRQWPGMLLRLARQRRVPGGAATLMRALTDWAKPLGADPACVDPARVLRLPGS